MSELQVWRREQKGFGGAGVAAAAGRVPLPGRLTPFICCSPQSREGLRDAEERCDRNLRNRGGALFGQLGCSKGRRVRRPLAPLHRRPEALIIDIWCVLCNIKAN